jgi:hypothetical protein
MSDDPFSMTRLRRILGRVAVVWLSGQLASAALSPLSVWPEGGPHAASCTCTHGVDDACPMHRNSAQGSRSCVLRAAAEPSAVLFTSLFGVTGLAAQRAQLLAPACRATFAISELQATVEQRRSPDPPPPRS